MKTTFSAYLLAALAGAASMLVPGASSAGNVGYNDQGGLSAGVPGAISALGHTPVPVSTLDSTSLSGLSALVLTSCGSQPLLAAPNAALNTAVQNGMTLIIESGCSAQTPTSFINSLNLPGAPTYSSSSAAAYPEADDIQIPAGSPIATGPGGTLTATSLDRIPAGTGGLFNMTHYYPRSALPTGATVLLTTGNNDHVGAFSWNVGSGRVIHTETQASFVLLGSTYQNNTDSFVPGFRIYFANLLNWGLDTFTTCAAEGFTGIKLTLCRQICELPQSPATLAALIKTYMAAFRQEPPCAR